MTFDVVEFVEDHSVDVVPTNWVNGNMCYWPPYRGLCLTAAVKNVKNRSSHGLRAQFVLMALMVCEL